VSIALAELAAFLWQIAVARKGLRACFHCLQIVAPNYSHC